MRKMFWVAVGAAGGIYAYRHGARLRDQLEREGLLRTAMSVGDDAVAAAGTTRDVLVRARTLLLGSQEAPVTVVPIAVDVRETDVTRIPNPAPHK